MKNDEINPEQPDTLQVNDEAKEGLPLTEEVYQLLARSIARQILENSGNPIQESDEENEWPTSLQAINIASMKNDQDEDKDKVLTEEQAAKNAETEVELDRADDVILDILFAEAERKVTDGSKRKD